VRGCNAGSHDVRSTDDDNITVGEQKRRLLAQKRLLEARTLRFYCQHHDRIGNVGFGTVGVRKFIKQHYADAKMAGFDWEPSPGAVIRALKECGSPHERPLTAFYDRRGKHDREVRWPEEILDLASKVIVWYWSKRSRSPGEALSLFDRAFRILVARRTRRGRPVTEHDPFDRPHEQTIRNWIKASRNYWTWS
jgi:putative transposase